MCMHTVCIQCLKQQQQHTKPKMVAQIFNPNTVEAKANGSQDCVVGPSLPLKKEEKLDLLLRTFI